MNPNETSAILAEGLTRRFGDFTAVDHIDLQVSRGDVFGFLGPNGAGKTTTIRMLLGLITPSEGRAEILGMDIARQRTRIQERIGYLSQRFSLYGDLTVDENIIFYGRTYGVSGARLKERRAFALDMTGLQGRERELARDLPGGFRQRLALACAILHEPQVLFLDEPTAGVDPISRREFWEFLYELANAGQSIFVTTHYMDEAENCQHLAFILAGRIILSGTPLQIKAGMHQQVLEIDTPQADLALAALRQAGDQGRLAFNDVALYGARLHLTGDDLRSRQSAIRSLLKESGIPVRSTEIIPPSLEDVFIASVNHNRKNGSKGSSAAG